MAVSPSQESKADVNDRARLYGYTACFAGIPITLFSMLIIDALGQHSIYVWICGAIGIATLALFVFAAVKLYQMQRNIRESRRRSGFSSGTQSVKRMVSAEEESENVKRRFIRQISTVSQRFSSKKSRPSYDALKEK